MPTARRVRRRRRSPAAGSHWSLVRRANARPGTAEVWKATAPGPLANATVTSTLADGTRDQALTVVAFIGSVGVGRGREQQRRDRRAGVSLTTIRAGSLIYGVGNDWDGADGAHARQRSVDGPPVGRHRGRRHDVDAGADRAGPGGAVHRDAQHDRARRTTSGTSWGSRSIRPTSVAPPTTATRHHQVAAIPYGSTAAVVSWLTDSGADTQVQYGPTTGYGSTTTLGTAKTLRPRRGCSPGLASGTTTHFRVLSRNGAGLTTSGDFTVTMP